DQAEDACLGRRRQGHAGEDRHHQGAPHQELRLQRSERDGRPQLRRFDLRARRFERVSRSRPHADAGPHRRPFKPHLHVQPTTLWDYPSQHYGTGMQGDSSYVGATPSYIIWNLVQRYTKEGDLIVDPFCGSGTTLDVAEDTNRRARGFDVAPYRPEIERAD